MTIAPQRLVLMPLSMAAALIVMSTACWNGLARPKSHSYIISAMVLQVDGSGRRLLKILWTGTRTIEDWVKFRRRKIRVCFELVMMKACDPSIYLFLHIPISYIPTSRPADAGGQQGLYGRHTRKPFCWYPNPWSSIVLPLFRSVYDYPQHIAVWPRSARLWC